MFGISRVTGAVFVLCLVCSLGLWGLLLGTRFLDLGARLAFMLGSTVAASAIAAAWACASRR